MIDKIEHIVLDDSELDIKHYEYLREESEKKQISKIKDINSKDSAGQQK